MIRFWGAIKKLKSKNHFKDEYYAYHETAYKINTESKILEAKWKFKRNWYGKYIISVSYNDPNLKREYEGHISSICGQFTYATIYNIVNREAVHVVIGNNKSPMDCIWLGHNESNTITTDYWFLSNDKYTKKNAKQYIDNYRKKWWAMQQTKSPVNFTPQ